MRQIALLLFVAILMATPSFAQSSINVYETFEGGSNGQVLTTSILNSGLVCNGAGGSWSLTGNASTQMQVSTAAEQPLPGAITACGKVFNPPDGTLGATYNLNTTSSGYARFSWSGSSKNASLGSWFMTSVPTSDTNFHSMLGIFNGTDYLSLMIHGGFFYLETKVNPNGNPNVGSFFAYTPNKWYWVTEQFQAFVNSSSMHTLAIYDCGTAQAPINPCAQVSFQRKVSDSAGPANPNWFMIGKGGDTGSPLNLVYYDNFLGDTTGQTFPILPTSGPIITSLSQTVGAIGTSITITGTNFGASQGSSTVTFNGTAATPTSWSATSIVAPVPATSTTGNVVVTVNGLPSNGINFTVTSAPTITSLSPASGPLGTAVTISGANFGASQGTGTVTLNGTPATPTTWSDTSIAVPVPAGATTGNVVVTAGGVASNGVNFTVTTGNIALVQHTSRDAGTTTSATLAFASPNTAGNWIAVCIRAGSSSSQVFTVSDSNGNSYRQALQLGTTATTITFAIFYAENIKGGTNTITVSDTVSGPLRFAILEYSGVATSNSLDRTVSAQGTSASPNSGTLTTTASGDVLLAAIGTTNAATFAAVTGYTFEDFVPAEPNTKLITEDQIQSVAGTASATASLAASDNWGALLAAFKSAPVGVAGSPANITATAGTPQSATVNTAFATQLQATVKDSFNNPVSGVTVTFTAPSRGASGTFAGGVNTATTNASGVATAAIFTANTTASGPYNVTASVSGVSAPANFTLTNLAGAAASIAASAGTPQSVTVNTAFATQLQATVKDSFNNPVSGATVTFTAPASGASGTFAGGINTATTNASGVATAPIFTANTTAGGPYTVTASVSGVSTPANFSLTNLAGAAASITATAGTPQSATVNKAFATQLQATVKDSFNNPVSGVTVTFTAPSSGASATFAGGVNTATTNASGVATGAIFTANSIAGGYTITASISGVSGPANFSLTNLAGAAASIVATAGTPQSGVINTAFATQLQATVKDSFNNPVSGVTVTFTAPASGASGTFAGGVNTATTNASGVATAPIFTANGTVGGPYTVTASVSGVATPANFSLTNLGNPPASIIATAGTPQSATINSAFAAQLQATVTDSSNNPVSGVTVTFTAPSSGASGTFAGGLNTATTNASGVATSAVFTANSIAGGPYTVTATVSGVSTPANFSLTNLAGAAAGITATAGTPQSATVNTAFATQFQATVTDAGNNPVSGVTVTFTAPSSGASGTFAGGVNTATTTASGVATAAVFTANSTAGGPYNVTASVSGVSTPANFSLTNLAGPAASVTATAGTPQSATVNTAFATQLQASVKDSFNNSVGGVTVTFTAPSSGASGTFAGGVNTATTNTSGVATAPVFTANSTAGGPYNVTASVSGVSIPANFSLTNLASVTANITLVQHTSRDAGTTTSTTLPFVSATTPGNWIAVCVRAGNSSAQVFTVSDSSGDTFHPAVQLGLSATNISVAIFYAENIKGGADTISVSDTHAGPLRIAILEYSGVATSNSLDVTAMGQGASTTPISGNLTTTTSGDLLLGAIVTQNPAVFTAGSGYTIEEFVPAEPNTKLIAEDQIQKAAGTTSAGATLAASDNWGAGFAAFKAATGGSGTAPTITSLSLTQGPVGATFTVNGSNFGSTQSSSTVSLNGTPMTASNWTSSSFNVTVPSSATTGNVVVTVGGVNSNGVLFTVTPPPAITSINPTSGPIGANIIITGTNFGPTVGTIQSFVAFNGTQTRSSNWSDTSITAPVPSGATSGNVLVNVGGVPSNGVLFTVTPAPSITSLSPNFGPVGTSVTITGANFGVSQGTSTVTFNGTTATPTSWSATSIAVPVPTGATSGNVIVTIGGVASNGVNFTVTSTTNIALVQHTSRDAGVTTTSSLAFVSPNTGGNWIAVVIRAGSSSSQVFTVTDSNGNTYRQAFQLGVTANPISMAIFYAENIRGGANTVTVSDTVSGPLRFAILEYSGVAASNSLDASPTTAQGNSTTPNSGSLTTGANGDLLLAEVVTNSNATFTAGRGYVIEEFVPAEPNTKLIAEDQIQASAGVASASATLGTADNWGAGLAAFHSASGVPLPVSVSLSPTTASVPTGYGTQPFTASVTNDYQKLGVTWSLSGVSCTGSTCGTLMNVTSTSVTYNGPANVPSPATVTLTATAVADNTKTASATINVTQGVLNVAVSPKRAAVTTSQTQQFTATVSNDPSNSGVTWTVDGNTGGNTTTGTISTAGLYTPGTQPGQHTVTAVSNANASVTASVTVAVTDLTGVFTHHNDLQRTGQNLKEYALTTANVNSSTFSKLFSCPVDGYIWAAPLYMANLTVGGLTRNVVFIATSHDSVYAFDADSPSCVQLWATSFLSPGVTTVSPADVNDSSNDMFPEIGITSTPVIDPGTNTIYVEAKTRDTVSSGCSTTTPCFFHHLHALDLLTGTEKFNGPVVISASNFDPRIHHQRPALLLNNGAVYIGFGSHGDRNNYHGWLMGYNATNLTQTFVTALANPTSSGNRGAVWHGGAGPASDASGNVYISTGNGTYDGSSNFGDSTIKLSPTGKILDWFTPFNQSTFNANDIDLGSSGVIILPDAVGSATHPHLALATGKVSILYFLDVGTPVPPQTTTMGKFNSATNNDVQEVIPVPPPNTTLLDGGIFGSPAYWNGNIYTTGVSFPLSQFQIANGVIATPQSAESSNTFPLRGATPVVSASGATNGIVWILDLSGWPSNGPAILDAYDATNVGTLLYSSPSSGTGAAAPAVKFTIPVVANGKVYIGGEFAFTVFGSLPN